MTIVNLANVKSQREKAANKQMKNSLFGAKFAIVSIESNEKQLERSQTITC